MEIRAFRGWRYARGDAGAVLAPPYDVLTQADKDALLARSDRNIVAVDLPHVPPDGSAPPEAYRAAADRLAAWRADGTLRREARPALYAYQQAFRRGGRSYTRRAMICAVRATDFGRDVIPHEQTWPGPRADRLMLTRLARMQLSPIFGFYDDPAGRAAGALWEAAAGPPDLHGTLGGVDETLHAVTDPAAIAAVASALRSLPVFIADGHHRYTTALAYRDELGEIPADHPANFVMFVLAAADDPGLIILPSHRVIRGLKDFDLEAFAAAAGDVMECRAVRLGEAEAADADAFLRGFGAHAMALVSPAGPGRAGLRAYVARPRDLADMARAAPRRSPAWRELDVAILHELLIRRLLAGGQEGVAIEYTPDARGALAAAETGGAQLVVFLQATPLPAVIEIARAGEFMPHKSTYFHPKPATGTVLYPLEPE